MTKQPQNQESQTLIKIGIISRRLVEGVDMDLYMPFEISLYTTYSDIRKSNFHGLHFSLFLGFNKIIQSCAFASIRYIGN